MVALIDTLRTGAWLGRARIRRIAFAVLAAGLIGAAFVAFTSDGLNDRFGRPLGSDFSNVYAAGTWVLDGEPAAPFDPVRQHAREKTIFGPETPFYGWHYPPFFLAVAAPLAQMPYALALAVWQGLTLLLYLLAIRTVLLSSPSPLWGGSRAESARGGGHSNVATPLPAPAAPTSPAGGEGKTDRPWLLLALAFPAVFINLGHGHNGFLTAGLFALALVQLDRRPVLAGILIACLVYKPQFGMLIPLALAASGRWRAFASAVLTVAALAIAATLAFGPEVWTAFLQSTGFTRTVVLEQGGTGWHKIQSVFSVVRMWGGGVPIAYAAQTATTLAVAAALIWLWRRRAPFAIQAAALLVGTVLATPYSLDYDLMLLAPAVAFWAAHGLAQGFAPYEKTLLAFVWLVPLVARSVAEVALVPLAVPLMFAAFALLLRRAEVETAFLNAHGARPTTQAANAVLD